MKKAIVTSLLFFLFLSVYAQVPYFRAIEVNYNNRSIPVYTIFQDKEHFLWLGCENGALRYDGREYQLFPFEEPNDKKKYITCFFQDKQNNLWMGCNDGSIYLRKRSVCRIFKPEEGLPKVKISAITQDADDRIWFATYGEGVYYLDQQRLYNIDQKDGLSDNYTYTAIAVDHDIWIGTDNGISVCSAKKSNKKIKTITLQNGLCDHIITSLKKDNSTILIGTQSKGVCAYDIASGKISFPLSSPWKYGSISGLYKKNNKWWIATEREGIVCMDDSVRVYSREMMDIESRITSFLQDEEGNLWIASGADKIIMCSDVFEYLNTSEYNIRNINSLCVDRKGALWFSTDDRLFKYDKGIYNEIRELKNLHIISIYEDVYGYLWLGTFDKGVKRYDPSNGKFRSFSEENGLINNNVLSIAGNEKEIWFATLGGVSRCLLNNNSSNLSFTPSFLNYNEEDGLGTNFIYQVYIDSKKRVWFATDGKGITVFENNLFHNFSDTKGLKGKIIYSITEDLNKNMWFVSAKEGLFKYNGTSFRSYGIKEGIRDMRIASVSGDGHGNLLICNEKGIDILNIENNQILYHGKEYNLNGIEPNLNAICRDKDGNIWIGSKYGIIRYTSSGQELWKGPQPILKDVKVFFRSISDTIRTQFNHNENYLTFEYAGIWYHDPQEVRYQVKLEKYDLDWIDTKDLSVTYSNLPPGEYTFRIRCTVNPRIYSARELRYHFVIFAPFWQKWWFYLIISAAALFIIYQYVRSREKKVKEKEQAEKDKIEFRFETLKNQINPHFLFNSFNTLAGIIETDRNTAVEYVERLSDLYRDILMYREKDVITLKEELQLLNNYFYLQKKRYGDKLNLEIDTDIMSENYFIAPLTLQLLVENAIKHNVVSREHQLYIRIYRDDEYLVIVNNVHPKEEKEISTGIGLTNIRNRYAILSDKEITVEESKTEFKVKIPLIIRFV